MKLTFPVIAWLACGVLAAVFTLVFVFTQLDLAISGFFYETATNSFPVGKEMPWEFFNEEDHYFVIGLALFMLVLLIAGLSKRRLRPLAVYGAFCLVAYIIGPLLIVNGLFKGIEIGDVYIGWARPRPRQIVDFNPASTVRFYHLWEPAFLDGFTDTNSSFPSGHVTAGAIVIVLFFVFKNVDFIASVLNAKTRGAVNAIKVVKYGGLLGSIALSILFSVSRIAAGAHFASDCMYSVIFVWGATAAVYYWVFNIPKLERAAMAARA